MAHWRRRHALFAKRERRKREEAFWLTGIVLNRELTHARADPDGDAASRLRVLSGWGGDVKRGLDPGALRPAPWMHRPSPAHAHARHKLRTLVVMCV